MNFLNILLIFLVISALAIGLVIWLGMKRSDGKLLGFAIEKIVAYANFSGAGMDSRSRAISLTTNLKEESKVNAGRINAIDAVLPGFRACLARQLGMGSDQLMAAARRLELKTDDVLNAIANFGDADMAEASRQKVAKLHQADLPRELTEEEQAEVHGGRSDLEEFINDEMAEPWPERPGQMMGMPSLEDTGSMTEEGDIILEAAAEGAQVNISHEGSQIDEIVITDAPPVPEGMKAIFINLETKRFASRAFAQANPDKVERRVVPALN